MRSHVGNSRVRTGGRAASSQQVAFELKHRVILSLNKLADRDTNQIGVDELEKTVDCLGPEGIAPFLSCIVETDSEQKSAVRKECVRIMGVLARFHGELLGPHLGKMAGSVVKRLKDTDTVVRDACVEAVGVFALYIVNSAGDGGDGFAVLTRPLFEALGEQNRYVQAGAALCLAKVVDECKKPPVQILHSMLSRVIKLLKNPHFMAKAALIELVRSIIEAGGTTTEHALSAALTGILEALKNTDWTTRKAASNALASISLNCTASLSSFKDKCIHALESCRFDKVKPVRDAVMQALQCWKSLHGRDIFATSEINSCAKENFDGPKSPDVTSVSEIGCRENISKKFAPPSTFNLKNQRSPLTIRKSSSSFNQSRELCKQDDWRIEISLPKNHSSIHIDDPLHEESEGSCITKAFESIRDNATSRHEIRYDDYEQSDSPSMLDLVTGGFDIQHANGKHSCSDDVNSSGNHYSVTEEEPESRTFSLSSGEQKSVDSNTIDFSPRVACNCCLQASNELSLIRKQLSEFESKQTNLLELVQVFMGNAMSNMSILQSKVQSLECAIDKISQDLVHSMSYPAINNSKIGRKNQSVSNSPRVSTCTPRPSTDMNYRPPSILSVKNSEVWEDSASSKSQSAISVKEFADTHRDLLLDVSRKVVPRANRKISSCGPQDSGVVHARKVQESSVSVCIPRGKVTTLENNTTLWKRIKDFMYKEDTEAAYIEALCTGDELVLIELMDKTGPVLEKLSDKVVNEVLCTLAVHILDQKFLGSIIPWLQQVVDLSTVHGPSYLRMSSKARNELLLSIQEASSMNYCSPRESVSLAQIEKKLRHLWCEESTRCTSNIVRRNTSKRF